MFQTAHAKAGVGVAGREAGLSSGSVPDLFRTVGFADQILGFLAGPGEVLKL
jgi:hypothetical protein